jgi:hypothetical protein
MCVALWTYKDWIACNAAAGYLFRLIQCDLNLSFSLFHGHALLCFIEFIGSSVIDISTPDLILFSSVLADQAGLGKR